MAAAKLYEEALSGLDKSQDHVKGAQLNEHIAFCKFKAAFQSKDREEFKENMKQAESTYRDASSLYEKGNSEALSKRARARSLFANFWIQDSNDERRTTIQQCVSLAEDAATALHGEIAKKELAEAHLDLVSYYAEALFLSAELQEKNQLFEKTLKTGETTTLEFEKLGIPKEQVRSIATAVVATGWSAESLLDPTSFREFGKQALILSTKAMEIAKQLGTSYEQGLAYFAAAVAAQVSNNEWSKALNLIKTGIQHSESSKDTYLLGQLYVYGITAAFWSSWSEEEDVEKESEIIRDGINLASKGIQSLEIPLQNQEITVAYGWSSECYRDLSYLSNDVEKKKEYLNKAIEVARRGVKYFDQRLPSDSIHALAKSLYFLATLEPNIEKRIPLLKESLKLREQTVQWAQALFPQAWDHGVMCNYLALVKAELSNNEENPQSKLELLQSAVSDMKQCIDICTTWAKDSSYMHATSAYSTWYGDILGQLYRLTEDAQDANKAVRAYQDAIGLLEKSGFTGEIPPIRWDIAKIHDQLGDYRAASEEFQDAAEDYRHAAEKIHASASAFIDLAAYMDAWNLIEEARIAHKAEQYSAAADHYARAATTLKQTRTWSQLTEHYEACSNLEHGEALARVEKEEEAIHSFILAADAFEHTGKTLEAKLKQASGKDEEDELRDWLRITDARKRYAFGRANLEEARLLDVKGEKTTSLAKYREASEAFKALLPESQNEHSRREIETLILFCQAWAKMKEAESKASPDLYTEAAELFVKAEKASEVQKSDLLALANASFCRALATGTRFRRARDPQLYSEIKRELETATDYYQEGGFTRAANWTRATQRLFDALLYLADAETQKEARKKAELYHLAEQHLQLAAKIYGDAGFTAKRDESLRHLDRAREEKTILLTPMEVLAENPAVSAGSVSPVSLVRDQALGAERICDCANVVGNLILRQRDVSVGGDLSLELEIANVGKTPAMLMKLENLAPEGFEIQHDKTPLHVEDGFINMKGKRLEYLKTDEVKIALKALRKGAYKLCPRILFVDDKGSYQFYDFEPTDVTVSELGISGWLRGAGR